jgi:hypothetical protein
MKTIYRLLMAVSFSLPSLVLADSLAQELALKAAGAKANVIHLAVAAMQCATSDAKSAPKTLAVIDYSLPSSQQRLWVFDLKQRKLILQEYVAHGRNSGENYANSFSNINGSYQSSLGLFRTLSPYRGKHGLSLRMEGIEAGVNDNALDRAIVIHGADYVNPALIAKQGRIGRSLGCPAVRRAVAPKLIDNLKDGQYVFAYYPDPQWLTTSTYLSCGGAKGPLASALADIGQSVSSLE